MGRASSAKKVARAARAGGAKATREHRNLGFPALLTAIVLVGLTLVIWAVINNKDVLANDTAPRAQGATSQGDHWHDAFGVDICGQFEPNIQDGPEDKEGIHTHGDGVIHIHPFLLRSAGDRATIGRFFSQVNLQVSDGTIALPDGKTVKAGETTCNGQPGKVKLAHWKSAQAAAGGAPPDEVIESGLAGTRLTENGGAFTLAFVPDGATIGAPASASKLEQLGAADQGTAPGQPGTTGGSGQQLPGSSGGLPTGGELPPTGTTGGGTGAVP